MRSTIPIILTGVLLIMGACGPQTPSKAQIQINTVGDIIEAWRPNTVVVSTGGIVTWLNSGTFPHAVISGEGIFSQNLTPGQSFNYTFSKSGTFTYHDDPDIEIGTIMVK